MNFWRNKILKPLLIVLFLGFYSSISFFVHSHIVDGVRITHSHFYNPFKNDKVPDHQHSKNEFILIYFLSQFLITSTVVFFIIKALKIALKKPVKIICNKNLPKKYNILIYGLRAPPINIINKYL